MTEYSCPSCGTKLHISLDEYNDDDSEFVRKKILAFVLGHEPYKGSIVKDGEKRFRFHLQTYDSPDVDIWISGVAEYSLDYGYPHFKVEFDKKEAIR